MTTEEIKQNIAKYKWYHSLDLAPGISTPGVFNGICDFIHANQSQFDFVGKDVLDIGARDCLHAIRAEAKGAKSVLAIDNDLSAGAKDFALPLLKSKVDYRHQNLYALEEKEAFDIVQLFGVLYHLRYPFNGLKKVVDATRVGGTILIEGGFLFQPELDGMELLWCPSPERSPYEPSSVTFFNAAGLIGALGSMGCTSIQDPIYWEPAGYVRRCFFAFQKRENVTHGYWEGLHTYHTRAAHKSSDWQPDQK